MKAVAVTCPNCGAKLSVAEASSMATCAYCGTASRVQRRTAFFERPLPPPPGPQPVAVQHHSATFRRVMISSLLLSIGGAGFGMWMSQRSMSDAAERAQRAYDAASGARGGRADRAQPASARSPWWQDAERLLLADVDGDGAPEVLGRTRRVGEGDEMRLVAVDASSGERAWEGPVIGTYSDTYQSDLAVTGDLLVLVTPRGSLRAFGLADGVARWEAQLDEKTAHLCEGGGEVLRVLGKDDVVREVRRVDGAVLAAAAGRRGTAACAPVMTEDDAPGEAPASHAVARRLDLSYAQVYAGPGGRVLAGARSTGTGMGMLAALDGTAARWKVPVAKDPLAAAERAPARVAIGGQEVCAAYHAHSITEGHTVSCFALADGARRWDQRLDGEVRGMAIVGDRVLLSTRGRLEARDLATGAPRWQFGEGVPVRPRAPRARGPAEATPAAPPAGAAATPPPAR